MSTTPRDLLKWATLLLAASFFFGAYTYAVSGFGEMKAALIVTMIGLVITSGIATVALATWVISVGVRGGRQA
jgi:hypothetical protein